MPWEPIPPREYLISLLGGLAIGVIVASAAIAAAILSA